AAVADAISRGDLCADIRVVISNNPEANGIGLALARGLRVEVVDRGDGRSRDARHKEIVDILRRADTELVVCAGFNEILTSAVTAAYPDRIINTHPSLLPSFGGGLHAQRDALEFGAKVTGCTVHFVTADLDNGPILVQRAVNVLEDDTEESLAARVLVEEHRALPEAIGLIAAGRVSIDGRRVRIRPEPVPTAS
ncbi:MAG TPA: phosphoribosylglycinamide formyltransferase, partial [Chloroflexota bacterium]|nr:phosphoribosylglycinamide formyltransferase [Chloroflexota bacterium]